MSRTSGFRILSERSESKDLEPGRVINAECGPSTMLGPP